MNIVITGAKGFIGKNLSLFLTERGYDQIFEIDLDTPESEVIAALNQADFVYHLAGINRPKHQDEFQIGNTDLTHFIVECLKKNGRNTPIMLSSSIQAMQDNAYGKSKFLAEGIVKDYAKNTDSAFYIFRLPNVFGKWCLPNYNSFIATFCHNILNNLEISIHDPSAVVSLVYIDDLCHSLLSLLDENKNSGYWAVETEYQSTVGEVAEILIGFKQARDSLVVAEVGKGLTQALYSTYVSYMVPDQFSYALPSYQDDRGVFCEMLKTRSSGQFSFFTAHCGVTRGGHYHHSKTEKFLIIKGQALFRFEHLITKERFELIVQARDFKVVETIPGWSHDITNIGGEELIAMLWANEMFDQNLPDTISKPL